MKLPPFEYACPASMAEAVALLAAHGGEAKPLAGGQSPGADAGVPRRRAGAPCRSAQNFRAAADQGRRLRHHARRHGALARHSRRPACRNAHPLLVKAVEHVAHYQIRNRGTVGGSLAHADPAAELPGIAVTCEAEIAAIGKAGERSSRLRISSGSADDRVYSRTKSSLKFVFRLGRSSDVSVFANLPAAAVISHWQARFVFRRGQQEKCSQYSRRRDRRRRSSAASCHSGARTQGNEIDEAALGRAEAAASAAVDPSDDIHASGAYRKTLIGVMVERALRDAGRYTNS